jgi:hypothetical protein
MAAVGRTTLPPRGLDYVIGGETRAASHSAHRLKATSVGSIVAGREITVRRGTWRSSKHLRHISLKGGMRANFLRDAKGRVQWLRLGGRLYRHVA